MRRSSLLKLASCLFLSLALSACTTKKTESSQRFVKDFPQGEQITVDLKKAHEESVGVISKLVYSSTERHQYYLRFMPNDIRWHNGDAEPKQLLVCANQNAYLHFINEQANPYYAQTADTQKSAAAGTTEQGNQVQDAATEPPVEPYVILKDNYVRFVDKRYFFKWLGEAYWADINKEEYWEQLKSCQTYAVPNANYYQSADS